jgi:hypothetical protein
MRLAGHSFRGVLPSAVCKTKCDHDSSIVRRPWPTRGCCAMVKRNSPDGHFFGLICYNYI